MSQVKESSTSTDEGKHSRLFAFIIDLLAKREGIDEKDCCDMKVALTQNNWQGVSAFRCLLSEYRGSINSDAMSLLRDALDSHKISAGLTIDDDSSCEKLLIKLMTINSENQDSVTTRDHDTAVIQYAIDLCKISDDATHEIDVTKLYKLLKIGTLNSEYCEAFFDCLAYLLDSFGIIETPEGSLPSIMWEDDPSEDSNDEEDSTGKSCNHRAIE
jgi:hypothetical protein